MGRRCFHNGIKTERWAKVQARRRNATTTMHPFDVAKERRKAVFKEALNRSQERRKALCQEAALKRSLKDPSTPTEPNDLFAQNSINVVAIAAPTLIGFVAGRVA